MRPHIAKLDSFATRFIQSRTLVVVLLCCSSGFSQQAQRSPSVLRQIIPGHYMYNSGTLNSGVIVTSEGVVVLDALNTEAVARAEREEIANTIRQPVRFLVSSTFHNNYSKGNIARTWGWARTRRYDEPSNDLGPFFGKDSQWSAATALSDGHLDRRPC